MPGFLAIDTESSGLPKYRDPVTGKPIPSDDPGQPRVAELAMVYLDADLNQEREDQFYVSPDGWEMDPGATAVNGLTTDFLKDYGRPIAEILPIYEAAIREDRIVIAFNAQFDCKMMRGELRRAGMDDLFTLTRNICVMRGSGDLGIEKANGKKGWPQLADVCRHFDIVQPDAHSALDDARAAAEIARHLKRLECLPEAAVHLAKGRD